MKTIRYAYATSIMLRSKIGKQDKVTHMQKNGTYFAKIKCF